MNDTSSSIDLASGFIANASCPQVAWLTECTLNTHAQTQQPLIKGQEN